MPSRAVAYELIKPSSRWLEVPILLAFNVLLVACAYIAVPLPFSPVPITGQTFGVLLVAMALGRVRGTGVVLAYLAEGAAGLPVFAGGAAGPQVLFGPTGGYLAGFVAAAFVVGAMAEHGWDRTIFRSIVAMTIGYVVIFTFGLAQLSFFVPVATLLAMGLTPFIPGMIIKIALAAWILPLIWKRASAEPRA
ncbi:MAG: biotin transporter BioY [candidate division Zixibacteria bacterium]|nr:biotin transporter BioY [candidate division Zixibacteria bacterium]